MRIDSFYTNGKLHGHKGEDYSIHGKDYFIICDGCSSSENSDITARIQAHIAKHFINTLRYTTDYELVAYFIGKDLYNAMSSINALTNNSTPLATLMIGFIDGDKIKVLTYGDGCVVFKHKDGIQKIINISYNTNAPYYPYYYTNKENLIDYKTNYPEAFKYIDFVHTIDWDIRFNVDKPYIQEICIQDLEYVYIFSDGIEEFTGLNGKIDINNTVSDFSNMKNTNGSFIQRRCTRQLKTYEKDGIKPMDDFSMAGVYFDE